MLLMQLALLILGVLCPYEIRLGYFTHILIFCLYLLATKNYKHLIFITILIMSLLLVWGQQGHDLKLRLMDVYPISIADVKAHSEFEFISEADLFLDEEFAWYHVLGVNKQRFSLKFSFDDEQKSESFVNGGLSQKPKKLTLKLISIQKADVGGSWLQKKLYRNGLSAELSFQVLSWNDTQKRELDASKSTLRFRLTQEMDGLFHTLESWPYLKALLIGNTEGLSQRERWFIKYLGLMHLFVISGLHIGFIYLIVSVAAKLLWFVLPGFVIEFFAHKLVFKLALLLPVTLFYAYLSGWGESVQRAVIMLFTWQMIKLFSVKLISTNVLLISLSVILLLNPLSIYSAGLWLSFSLVLLLLLYFESDARQSFQAVKLQVLLSLCATSLILGWQISVSSGVILINLICLPIVGLFLFPLAFIASLIGLIFTDISLMIWLDGVLIWALSKLDYLVLNMPSLSLNRDLGLVFKLTLYFVCVIWVLYRHKVYVWLCFPLLLSIMIFAGVLNSPQKNLYRLSNNSNILALKSQQKSPLLSSYWVNNASEMSLLWVGDYLADFDMRPRLLVWPFSNAKVTASTLRALSPRWIILKSPPDLEKVALLDAMNVSWVVLAEGEEIKFEFWRKQWVIKHSNCLIFLISGQESNCMRVAELESVVNYSPKH